MWLLRLFWWVGQVSTTFIIQSRNLGPCAKRAWPFWHVPHQISIVLRSISVLWTFKSICANYYTSTSIWRYFSKNNSDWKPSKNGLFWQFLLVSRFKWFLKKYLQIEAEVWKLVQMQFKVYRTDFDQEAIDIWWATCPNDHALLCMGQNSYFGLWRS